MTALPRDEAIAKLKTHFLDHSGDKYAEGWSKLWDAGDNLPWDRLKPHPGLAETLEQGEDVIGKATISDETGGSVQRKKALVPGCGRGVDVLLLQSFGYDVLGLEVSPQAVVEAEKYGKEHEGDYKIRDEQLGRGSRRYVHGDFYKDDWLKDSGVDGNTFDLIYDYTFFCAMNPLMRPAWSKRMSELLKHSSQANLICLEFPRNKPAKALGPPYGSPSNAYMEHLSHPGEKIPYDDDGNVRLNPLVGASKNGLERVAHYTPANSHAIGKNEAGEVTDKIAIWRHR